MDRPKKFIKKLYDAFASQLPYLYSKKKDEEQFFSPTNSLEKINITSLDNSTNEASTKLKEKSDHQHTNTDEKIISDRIDALSLQNGQGDNSEFMDEDYKKLLSDFDMTLSFVIENAEPNNNSPLKQTLKEKDRIIEKLNLKLEKYIKNVNVLKKHIKSLEIDLINSNGRVQAYKEIAFEKINFLNIENQKLRECIAFERKKNEKLKNSFIGNEKNIDELETLLKNINLNEQMESNGKELQNI